MLEVRNLKKVYKTKKGADVNALDGVSLNFPQTGMVFLLGKSGSGKSTLLNVCGGLDNPTSGEIIVKGRSSKDFSQSDFDSYRNTFIGFIFQEYNILNEFSVEDNIALALELQGKPKDKAAITALLKEVDLAGFAKRKPNTLSGGQKQRIAIARALVKKPEIIMADEPTGALDSNTGKQVFDTLKKLSRDKLVIVVSHDRDFAEQYGDRIIELKDGQVISDVSKAHAEPQKISSGVDLVGDVLCIKKGAELTEQDFANIKEYLKKAENDIVIASDEKSVKTFKSAARITDSGEMEVFRDTGDDAANRRSYTKEESRFIRSKLPMRHAAKIGVSGLKSKPFRLFFTVLLCSIAFILFGLLSTLSFYDSKATFRQTLLDSQISVLPITKDYQAEVIWYNGGVEEYRYKSAYTALFSDGDLQRIAAQLNANAFGGVEAWSDFRMQVNNTPYWVNEIRSIAVLPEGNALRGQLQGAYPADKNEIAVSSYFAQMLKECKVYDKDGNVLDLANPADLVGKTIYVGGQTFKVTGILDSGEVPAEYDALKDSAAATNYTLVNKYRGYLESNLHLMVFVSPDTIDYFLSSNPYYTEDNTYQQRIAVGYPSGDGVWMPDYGNGQYKAFSKLPGSRRVIPFSGDQISLTGKQVVFNSVDFARTISEQFRRLWDDAPREDAALQEYYSDIIIAADTLSMNGRYEYSEDPKEEPKFIPLTDAEYQELVSKIVAAMKKDGISAKVYIQLFDQDNQVVIGDVMEYEVAGVYVLPEEQYDDTVYVTDEEAAALWQTQKLSLQSYSEMVTKYQAPKDGRYGTIYLPGNVAPEIIETLWDIYSNDKYDENDTRTNLTGNFIMTLQNVDYMVESLSKVFLYIGLVLAGFAMLLLSNFISVSISNKTREIGILRAVGARSNDVFKIFFSESCVIGIICVAISSAACLLLCGVLNREAAAGLGAALFVFGIPSFAVILGIALVTIVIATFLPVYRAARKKPVDSIRSL